MTIPSKQAQPRAFTGQNTVNGLQDAGATALRVLAGIPILSGALIDTDPQASARGVTPGTGVAFNAGETREVPHGADGPLSGVFAVGVTGSPSTFCSAPGSGPRTVRITSSAACVAKFWGWR